MTQLSGRGCPRLHRRPAGARGHGNERESDDRDAGDGDQSAGQPPVFAGGLSDGSAVTFRVDRVISAPKDAFPTDEVYGPTPDSQLRLITCGGSFNPVAGSYLDNTIVFATAIP